MTRKIKNRLFELTPETWTV